MGTNNMYLHMRIIPAGGETIYLNFLAFQLR